MRCRPELAPGSAGWDGHDAYVKRAMELTAAGALSDERTVEDLADYVGVGARHLRRLFDVHVGASPIQVVSAQTVALAKTLLVDSELSRIIAHVQIDRIADPHALVGQLRHLVDADCDPEVLTSDLGDNPWLRRSMLLTIPGIGPWTMEYIALRSLGDPDAFPVADLGILKASRRHRSAMTAKALAEFSERWRPWRGYAAMHLWASLTHNETEARR